MADEISLDELKELHQKITDLATEIARIIGLHEQPPMSVEDAQAHVNVLEQEVGSLEVALRQAKSTKDPNAISAAEDGLKAKKDELVAAKGILAQAKKQSNPGIAGKKTASAVSDRLSAIWNRY